VGLRPARRNGAPAVPPAARLHHLAARRASTIDRTTLTRTVDCMQEALIERPPTTPTCASPARAHRLRKKMFERIWPEVQRLNELALAGLSSSEIILKKIPAACTPT
jgi:hypothetical protein